MLTTLTPIVTAFFATRVADARRVLHGRGQLYPGLEALAVDWLPPVVLISAYAPLTDSDALVALLRASDVHGQIRSIVLQHRDEQQSPADLLWGEHLEELVVSEGGLRFLVRPGRRQNAGLFLDTRLLRDWLLGNCHQRKVVNLFAYTCSLSVAALAGGAHSVCNVDMSRPSIQWGEANHVLNNQALTQVKSIPHNLFTSWGRIQQFGRYDLVLVDPPTRQRGSFNVERDYAAVLKKLPKLCAPGAHIIATLNSPFLPVSFLHETFARILPHSEFVGRLPTPPEFADRDPEQALKICHYRLPLKATA